MNAKDKTTAALLCFFLGGISAHRFYVGKPASAFAQAALAVGGAIVMVTSVMATPSNDVGGVIGIFALIGGVLWIIFDFVMILLGRFTDGAGNSIGKSQPRTEPMNHGVASPHRVQQRILLTAKQQGGLVGPTEVAMRAGIDIDEAKRYLEGLVDKGHAEIQLRKDGALVYVFPELLTEEKRNELDRL